MTDADGGVVPLLAAQSFRMTAEMDRLSRAAPRLVSESGEERLNVQQVPIVLQLVAPCCSSSP